MFKRVAFMFILVLLLSIGVANAGFIEWINEAFSGLITGKVVVGTQNERNYCPELLEAENKVNLFEASARRFLIVKGSCLDNDDCGEERCIVNNGFYECG